MESKEKRQAISISLTKNEQAMLREKASDYGLSLSAFLRLAAKAYPAQKDTKGQTTEDKSD